MKDFKVGDRVSVRGIIVDIDDKGNKLILVDGQEYSIWLYKRAKIHRLKKKEKRGSKELMAYVCVDAESRYHNMVGLFDFDNEGSTWKPVRYNPETNTWLIS